MEGLWKGGVWAGVEAGSSLQLPHLTAESSSWITWGHKEGFHGRYDAGDDHTQTRGSFRQNPHSSIPRDKCLLLVFKWCIQFRPPSPLSRKCKAIYLRDEFKPLNKAHSQSCLSLKFNKNEIVNWVLKFWVHVWFLPGGWQSAAWDIRSLGDESVHTNLCLSQWTERTSVITDDTLGHHENCTDVPGQKAQPVKHPPQTWGPELNPQNTQNAQHGGPVAGQPVWLSEF